MTHSEIERELAEIGGMVAETIDDTRDAVEGDRWFRGCADAIQSLQDIQRRLAGLIATLDAEREAGRAK